MKRRLTLLLFVLMLATRVWAQEQEIQQLLLNVEKLARLKEILGEMENGYQVLSAGYTRVRDISQGSFHQHQTYLAGLLQVSPTVKNYHKVARIIRYQVLLVREYRQAYTRFKADGNFSPQELDYMRGVYERLFRQSLDNLDALTTVVTATALRMTDDERLQAIDALFREMEEALLFLRHFNKSTTLLAVQRHRAKSDVAALRRSYGINH
ncbi:TerB family tellurite resistance protein [Pontibacter liquoris]|uniref:tellurite resistance TerB family protein n=1 Tax=Pontibacter liquoris TaxID=2905677 RepID=UPI001FA6BCD5|nr:TerB family tellurite resistance protein [Pontibacter liquoris]